MRKNDTEVERNCTIVVKTFERPTVLRRLVRSIRRFYPDIPLFVVDDSEEPLDPAPEGVTRYWRLPFNVGVSFGRNFGLKQVETEYVLFTDDDLVFETRTDLSKMLAALRSTPFDVVSCNWVDHEMHTGIRMGVRRFEGTLEIVDGAYVHRYQATRGTIDGLPVYDVLHNFFMAPTDRLGEDPWDARIKTEHEHGDLFLTLKERGLLFTRLPDVFVYHYPERPPRYVEFRGHAGPWWEIWSQKRGIEREVFVGRQFRRGDRLLHYYPSKAAHIGRRVARVARRLVREGRLRAAQPSSGTQAAG